MKRITLLMICLVVVVGICAYGLSHAVAVARADKKEADYNNGWKDVQTKYAVMRPGLNSAAESSLYDEEVKEVHDLYENKGLVDELTQLTDTLSPDDLSGALKASSLLAEIHQNQSRAIIEAKQMIASANEILASNLADLDALQIAMQAASADKSAAYEQAVEDWIKSAKVGCRQKDSRVSNDVFDIANQASPLTAGL